MGGETQHTPCRVAHRQKKNEDGTPRKVTPIEEMNQWADKLADWAAWEVFFGFVKSREKKYTTSPKHNTELLGYGQLGPSFCSSGSVLLLLLYCSSTPPLLQLTAQFPPCRRPSPQQICLLQICLRRLDAYPTYRLADRLGRSSALLSFGYDSQYFGISHIVVFVLC